MDVLCQSNTTYTNCKSRSVGLRPMFKLFYLCFTYRISKLYVLYKCIFMVHMCLVRVINNAFYVCKYMCDSNHHLPKRRWEFTCSFVTYKKFFPCLEMNFFNLCYTAWHKGGKVASVHAPNSHRGIRGIAPLIFNLGTRWTFTLQPLYTRERTAEPINLETGWASWPVWTVLEKISCPRLICSGIKI